MATTTKRTTRSATGNGARGGNGKEQSSCCAKAAAAEQPKPVKKATTPVHVPPGHGRATARATASSPRPTPEQIAERAYLIWELQGRQHGRDMENWLEAERQLSQEMGSR